jgi:hypothetical protein
MLVLADGRGCKAFLWIHNKISFHFS